MMGVSSRSSSPAGLGRTHLSRFRARAVPCSLCRRGFAASMPADPIWPRRARLCVVKVKLTMGLAIPARGVEWNASGSAGLSEGLPARLIHRWRRTVWSSRGRGGDVIPAPARKDRRDKGGRSQRPPFFFDARARVRDAVQRPLAMHRRAGTHVPGLSMAWVPALRRVTARRAASGTRRAAIVHLHGAGKAAYLGRDVPTPPCKVRSPWNPILNTPAMPRASRS
jgi:hypothetical protein